MKSTKTKPLTIEQIRQLVAEKQEENKKKLLARASKKITPDQGLYIKYRLKCVGCSSIDIAQETGCTKQAVSNVLSGKAHSQRIERVVAAKLGYPSWNEMVQTLREMAA
ncbi:MAG: hypothetical protein IJJ71_12165 [Treponema sp.]|uniref:hypothetical protein n=1 Tax=Treponema sp. TaxID=166 RepID=UPI0025DBC200|nr:hypothetical protein [Treponema sp.]MBR0496918.1 hypothetical protein [Treponema sp.]